MLAEVEDFASFGPPRGQLLTFEYVIRIMQVGVASVTIFANLRCLRGRNKTRLAPIIGWEN